MSTELLSVPVLMIHIAQVHNPFFRQPEQTNTHSSMHEKAWTHAHSVTEQEELLAVVHLFTTL